MTFIELFENLKNHSYIRRESWSKDVFIQYRHTAPLIRLIKFEEIPNDLAAVDAAIREYYGMEPNIIKEDK